MTDPIDLGVLGGYALVLLAIGAASLGHGKTSERSLLADRTLGATGVFAATFPTFYGTGIVVTFASFGSLYGVGAVALPVVAVVGSSPWLGQRPAPRS